MKGHLTDALKTTRVLNSVVVGTSSQTSSVLDMAGYDGVRFFVLFGAITDGTLGIKVQQDTDVAMGAAADVEGTLVSGAVTDDNKMIIVDVFRPRERYVQCIVLRGGAVGGIIDGVIAEQYNAINIPVTASSTVAAQEKWSSPVEGTA